MSKQKKLQQYVFKINSTLLAKNNFNLTLPLEQARKVPGLVVSLADSQILSWINELNGTENYDNEAKIVKSQIKALKKLPGSKETRSEIASLYAKLYALQFREDYVSIVMDKKSDYDRCNKGFQINGVTYKRLICTTGGVKTSTVVYTSERLLPELKKRIANGRNEDFPLVPAKLGAYEALAASASLPVSWPKGVIVISDCKVTFNADLINIDDSDSSKEPLVEFAPNQEVKNNCSDGCSMMLPSLSRRWNGELNGDFENTISGCNLRCAWTKGMTFTFDFVKFAEEVMGASKNRPEKYLITDIWGDPRDVRDAELIMTESQLKLWNCYDSWEDYYNKCIENHYTIRIAKVAPTYKGMDEIRQLNYQFIQSLNLTDEDIEELIAPTVNEIKDILGLDPQKSIVYLCGKKLDDDTIYYVDSIAKALMIEPRMIEDPYIRSRIRKMIDRRIRDAKIGVLDVYGNFQIIAGDLFALCEHMFGLEPHGILKSGELYSQFWSDRKVARVMCARAPMSNEHSLVSQDVCYNEKAHEWFKYMDSVVIVNAWDTMPMALNGFDMDGDLLFTTNNAPLLRRQHNLPALNCIQYKATMCKVKEQDVVRSNKLGFGSEIGSITNRITEMTSLMSLFDPDSDEYKVLKYRTQCGQAQQQAEIDKAKGIISNPMPKSWYVYSENRIKPEDSEETVERKQLYKKICAHKKSYFFGYNYPSLMTEYNKYNSISNENSMNMFGKTIATLLNSQDLSEDELKFLSNYKARLPLEMAPSTMNRICWSVERAFDDFVPFTDGEFDYSVMKCNVEYSLSDYNMAKHLCREYKKRNTEMLKSAKSSKNSDSDKDIHIKIEQLLQELSRELNEAITNSEVLCDILLDLCYRDNINKQIAWYVCGQQIIDNLLKSHNYQLSYPLQNDQGDFICCGSKFQMKQITLGGDNNEEFQI